MAFEYKYSLINNLFYAKPKNNSKFRNQRKLCCKSFQYEELKKIGDPKNKLKHYIKMGLMN